MPRSSLSRSPFLTSWRRFASVLALAGAAVLAASCGNDKEAAPPTAPEAGSLAGPLFGATNPANGPGQCMANDAVSYSSLVSGVGPGNNPVGLLNCTSNDIEIASVQVLTVNGDPYTGQTLSCNEGEILAIGLNAILQQNAESERQDIGLWVATDGGDAETGACDHFNLPTAPLGPNTTNADGDQCAGMLGQKGLQATVPLGILNVPCSDLNNDGQLDIGACVAWKVPADDQECPNNADGVEPDGQATDFRAGTLPSNKSKCNCEPFHIPITINLTATIEVTKACVPANDPGTFDLKIDGAVEANDAICGGTTGAVTVGAGTTADPGATHTVAEDGFTTANYTSTYACTRNGAPDATLSGSGVGPFDVAVQPDDVIVCTFTNTRKGGLTIIKDAVPNNAQDFGFTTTGTGLSNFSLDDDADGTLSNTRSFTNLAPGAYSVTEPATAGWTLTNISCSGATASTVTIGAAGGFDAGDNSVSVTLAAGETVTCTFTNKKHGSITIVKDAQPDAATDFAFSAAGPGVNPANFSLDDDADGTLSNSQAFTDLVPDAGNRTFTETPDAAWVLTNIACTGATTSSVTIGAAGGFSAGDVSATIGLAPGEDITCTFTNQRKARLIVTKTITGGGLQVFDFTRSPGGASFQLGDGDSEDTGYTLLPNTYTVCENDLAVTWTATATIDAVPATLYNPDMPEDFGNRCVDVALAYGDSKTVAWTNTAPPPPGGDARTIGYWKNWSSCTGGRQYQKAEFDETLDGNLPQTIGDLVVDTCTEGVHILSKEDLNGRKRASDAAYNLAAQLLAAKLNVSAGAGVCPAATTAMNEAQTLLDNIGFDGTGQYLRPKDGANYTLANSLAATLDSYNNNTLCP